MTVLIEIVFRGPSAIGRSTFASASASARFRGRGFHFRGHNLVSSPYNFLTWRFLTLLIWILIWGFPEIGVALIIQLLGYPQFWTPKIRGIRGNPIKIDDLEVPPILETKNMSPVVVLNSISERLELRRFFCDSPLHLHMTFQKRWQVATSNPPCENSDSHPFAEPLSKDSV